MRLSVSKLTPRTTVLGPGTRAVIWVRGCPLRCEGCLAPEDLDFEGGQVWQVDALARLLCALPEDISGVTFSGGEPMAQAAALAALVTEIRRERDWSVMAYSGFTIEHLRRGDSGQLALLAQLDILVDGPYLVAKHASLLWRGSSNQRLHFLTDRHRPPGEDQSAGIELIVNSGGLQWVGVPPEPGFRDRFAQAMAAEGIRLSEGVTDVR